AHNVRHRAPALDGPPGDHDPADGRRQGHRARHARPSHGRARNVLRHGHASEDTRQGRGTSAGVGRPFRAAEQRAGPKGPAHYRMIFVISIAVYVALLYLALASNVARRPAVPAPMFDMPVPRSYSSNVWLACLGSRRLSFGSGA